MANQMNNSSTLCVSVVLFQQISIQKEALKILEKSRVEKLPVTFLKIEFFLKHGMCHQSGKKFLCLQSHQWIDSQDATPNHLQDKVSCMVTIHMQKFRKSTVVPKKQSYFVWKIDIFDVFQLCQSLIFLLEFCMHFPFSNIY